MSRINELSKSYKPFYYPWAMEYAEAHEKIHWGSWEAKLVEDVNQWKSNKIKGFFTPTLMYDLTIFPGIAPI